jgi:hypothetical protein
VRFSSRHFSTSALLKCCGRYSTPAGRNDVAQRLEQLAGTSHDGRAETARQTVADVELAGLAADLIDSWLELRARVRAPDRIEPVVATQEMRNQRIRETGNDDDSVGSRIGADYQESVSISSTCSSVGAAATDMAAGWTLGARSISTYNTQRAPSASQLSGLETDCKSASNATRLQPQTPRSRKRPQQQRTCVHRAHTQLSRD